MGSPGADGNAASAPQLAFTNVGVRKFREIEDHFIMPFAEWRKSWQEIFMRLFREEYPGDVMHWPRMLVTCMKQKDETMIPDLLLKRYREELELNRQLFWK